MQRLIECVPNFSEGRDAARIAAIVTAMSGVAGAYVLDCHSDADHNRCVVTLAGEPEAVAEAALRGVGKAAELIDLNRHSGVHPRIGATDVLPFVPVEGLDMNACVALAREVGSRIWERYRIPVYLYEAAATRPGRTRLEEVRRGQFEGLREEALRNADRAPDIGGPGLHSTAGAVAVGARKFLVAYNINLNTPDVTVANSIARVIRTSGGGLPAVKAMGVSLSSRGIAQVSINLTDLETTSLQQVYDAVRREAEQRGCAIAGSEIVGLVPQKALDPAAESFRKLDHFSPSQVIENRLAAALANMEAAGVSR
jgi:glutamate formiminotransferase